MQIQERQSDPQATQRRRDTGPARPIGSHAPTLKKSGEAPAGGSRLVYRCEDVAEEAALAPVR